MHTTDSASVAIMQGSYTGAVTVCGVPLSFKSNEAEDASDVRQLYDGDDILATSLKIYPLKRLPISRVSSFCNMN